MNTLHTLIVVVQVLAALAIIGLVLLQHGKGADMGAAFGSGASGSLFGATGSSNFLSKSTGIAAVIFFAATLTLSLVVSKRTSVSGGVMENLPAAGAAASSPAGSASAAAAVAAKPASAAAATAVLPASAAAGASASGAASAAQEGQIPK